MGLPTVFFLLTILQIVMALWVVGINQNEVAPILWCFSVISFSVAVFALDKAVWRVEISQDYLTCKGLLPRKTFVLEYKKCNVGMDYHEQNGNKIWWIYLCYGSPPWYQAKRQVKRINAEAIRPGFVKIMYSDQVYSVLISTLPKKQRSALESSLRCAGFDGQGRII